MEKKFMVFLDAELHKQIKLKAVEKGISMNQLVINALTEYLKKQKKGGD
jgi:predicted HicB family RNase H-like nuclease